MDTATQVQILDEAFFISDGANTLEKGINSTILLPAMGKIIRQIGLFNLVIATGLGEGKL